MTDILSAGKSLCSAIPYDDIARIGEIVKGELYEAAACFWTFRVLHSQKGAEMVLLGDYAFGRFSYHLSKLDNVPLTDAFADYLAEDADRGLSLEDYLEFLGKAASL